jgi:hypothetical protein
MIGITMLDLVRSWKCYGVKKQTKWKLGKFRVGRVSQVRLSLVRSG